MVGQNNDSAMPATKSDWRTDFFDSPKLNVGGYSWVNAVAKFTVVQTHPCDP